MNDETIQCFNDYFNFPVTEQEIAEGHFKVFKTDKKDFLVREGSIATDYFLILNGYVRTFYIAENGVEVTIDILRTGEFASSMYSILKKAPSFENIQCISPCTVCRISEASFEKLAVSNPKWIDFGMQSLKAALLKKEEKILSFGKLKGKERYAKLMTERPDIIQHVPVQYIASYLGMKPESLSRIRS